MQVTVAVAVVLRAFLDDPVRARYGYDLMRQTGFASGKLYPILDRLDQAGWLDREREVTDASAEGRPPRVFYRLTATGIPAARAECAALSDRLHTPERGMLPRPLPAGAS
jgi:PadR family transcriptional regulator, regulatory protein PadR